jgi:hypothetical protein
MMLRHLPLAGLMTVLTLAPLSAAAYVTPDEALDDETYTTRFYEPPPSTREIDEQVEAQRLRSAERRDAEQDAIKPQPEPTEEELHEAAPEEEEETDIDKLIELIKAIQGASSSSASSAPAVPFAEDPVTQRLFLRLQAQKEAAARQDFIQNLLGGEGETLHSGAPLTETGPATVLVTLAVAGAIGETWRRARKAEVQH